MKLHALEKSAERSKRIAELYSQGPVKRGLIYCSPWCGAGCTIMAFDAAGIKARALVDKLGPGWEPSVTENMGWHYGAVNGALLMSEYDDRKTKFKDGFGKLHYSLTTGTTFVGKGSTPQAALADVLPAIEAELRKLNKLHNAIKGSLK